MGIESVFPVLVFAMHPDPASFRTRTDRSDFREHARRARTWAHAGGCVAFPFLRYVPLGARLTILRALEGEWSMLQTAGINNEERRTSAVCKTRSGAFFSAQDITRGDEAGMWKSRDIGYGARGHRSACWDDVLACGVVTGVLLFTSGGDISHDESKNEMGCGRGARTGIGDYGGRDARGWVDGREEGNKEHANGIRSTFRARPCRAASSLYLQPRISVSWYHPTPVPVLDADSATCVLHLRYPQTLVA
ncbi:hypothetical protein C8R44DRAFT_991763 [Mycena epipterygia]|nr:hypothetical protein C8R44DRAFT_991763 [Mycena epipterygia]